MAALQQQQRDITNICPRPETVVERDDVIKGRRRGPGWWSFGASGGTGEEKSIPVNMLVEEREASSLNFLILASSKYFWLHVCKAQSHRGGDEGKNGLSWQQLDRRGPCTREGGGANVPVGIQRSGFFEEDVGHSAICFFYDTICALHSLGVSIEGETQAVNKETSVVHAIKDNAIGPTC